MWARQGVDIEKDQALHNLACVMGLMWGIRQILRLIPGGLATFAYPCNSWGFMASSQHARSEDQPWGNLKFPFVQMGNLISTRATMLWGLALARSVMTFGENPQRSKILLHPLIAHIRSFPELCIDDMKWSWARFPLCCFYWYLTLLAISTWFLCPL